MRCADLLGAADDDRAAAAMFYYGYLAGKAGIRIIDVGKIDENVGKVMKPCAATPKVMVPKHFATRSVPAMRSASLSSRRDFAASLVVSSIMWVATMRLREVSA